MEAEIAGLPIEMLELQSACPLGSLRLYADALGFRDRPACARYPVRVMSLPTVSLHPEQRGRGLTHCMGCQWHTLTKRIQASPSDFWKIFCGSICRKTNQRLTAPQRTPRNANEKPLTSQPRYLGLRFSLIASKCAHMAYIGVDSADWHQIFVVSA